MKIKDSRFEHLREGIVSEIYKAKTHLEILRVLNEPPNKELRDIRYHYVTFFFSTMYAHSDRFCLSIYNLTKYNKKTHNIPHLLNYIRSHKELSTIYTKQFETEMIKRIEAHRITIDRIVNLRCRNIAHNEIKRETYPKLRYYKEGADELVKELGSITNDISTQYDEVLYDPEFTMSPNPKNNTYYVLEHLREFKDKAF